MRIPLVYGKMRAEVDTRGAEWKMLQKNGVDYLWRGDARFWEQSAPILFPIVCDVRDQKTVIEGREYHLQRHGFAQEMEFSVREKSDSSVTLALESSEQTLRAYPYRFCLTAAYRLRENGISIVFTVRNDDEKTMFFQLGVHPGFRCPISEKEAFEDYEVRFEKRETLATPLLNARTRLIEPDVTNFVMRHEDTIPLRRELFLKDALVFDSLESRSVELSQVQTGQGVRVSFADFGMLGMWTPAEKEAPFLCIEPWNGTATYVDEGDELRQKRGIEELGSGDAKQYGVTVDILDGEEGERDV